MIEMRLSKKSALVWAGKEAVASNPHDWDCEVSWVLANEDRYRGIGRSRQEAIIDAARTGNLHVDLEQYLRPNGVIAWSDMLQNIDHGAMSEFISTPYGVLFMDNG